MSNGIICVDCGARWHEPDTNNGHCQRCRADLFYWHLDGLNYSTRPIPVEKIEWVILRRDGLDQMWRVHSHPKGSWYRYCDIDNAVKALNDGLRGLKNKGHAKVERSDRVHLHGIKQLDRKCIEIPEPPRKKRPYRKSGLHDLP